MYKVGKKMRLKWDFDISVVEVYPDKRLPYLVKIQSKLEDNSTFSAFVDEYTLLNPSAAFLAGLVAQVNQMCEQERKDAELAEINEETELLPCPFCGSKAYLVTESFWGDLEEGYEYAVACINHAADMCSGYTTLFPSPEFAIRAWNKRTIDKQGAGELATIDANQNLLQYAT